MISNIAYEAEIENAGVHDNSLYPHSALLGMIHPTALL